jgi:16S rRNA (cytosine967-C5)-methyltransferase
VAEQFPAVEPPPADAEAMLSGMSPADRALALAIYRTSVQRWFTLQHLLEQHLSKQLRRLEPAMQAVLVSGAAQLVFFDRLPAYAVVDESVRLAHRLVRPNAKSMVNAVLRKIDRLVGKAEHIESWRPDAQLIPLAGGGAMRLPDAALPEADPLDKHLVAATSVPLRLVREWQQRFDRDRLIALCLQTLENPPTTIAVETPFEPGPYRQDVASHAVDGAVVWRGPSENLGPFLAMHSERRVQDAASMLAVASSQQYKPETILDYCAGQGTKTRQLALLHPQSRVFATDTHPGRREALRSATAGLDNVEVIDPDSAGDRVYDLIVLDVPCSNTGVLARRPEARYRYAQQAIGELVKLQREIIATARPWLAQDGLLLYSTCSIESSENKNQIKRLVKQGAELLTEHQQLPQGRGETYTDGSYHALVKC